MIDYDQLFKEEEYNPPEKEKIKAVYEWIKKKGYKDLVDVGCGRGHYLKFLLEHNINIRGFDPSKYVVEHDLKNLPAKYASIISYKGRHEAFYCMDVLEHLEPTYLYSNLKALTRIAPHGLIGVASHSDKFGGKELHLIQENGAWWHKVLETHFKNVANLFNSDRYMIFEVHNV